MAGHPPELIACEDCGCLNERATALLAQVQGDLERAERDLRAKRSRIAKLESDRTDKLRSSPHYESALRVLRHWSARCMPTAKEVDSPERLAVVLARINGGHTEEELKLCADGYAKLPYVTEQGRSAHGSKRQWFADAETIYKTAERVRKGVAYASTASTGPGTGNVNAERLSWRAVKSANRRLILRALTERFGKPLEDDGTLVPGWLMSPCPRCDNDPALTLRIAPAGEDYSYIARCSACGLDETRLIAAITEDTDAAD